MALSVRAGLATALVVVTAGLAYATPPATLPSERPAPSALDVPQVESDMWIFSGVLEGHSETFSGTLVAGKEDNAFELKLGDGATCDGENLKGEIGLVRLSDVPCSDGRALRALFVPQGGRLLKVFGRVGEQRFMADAHLLGDAPPPEKPQTLQPTAPKLQPRRELDEPLPNAPPPEPGAPQEP